MQMARTQWSGAMSDRAILAKGKTAGTRQHDGVVTRFSSDRV